MNFHQFSDWPTDTRIPGVLSNEENQFLEERIEAKVKDFTSIQLDIEENLDRIQMLDNHRKLVHDELQIIQVDFLCIVQVHLDLLEIEITHSMSNGRNK